jgi:iron-sulfur cluster repair protein YtfE (RIC family)
MSTQDAVTLLKKDHATVKKMFEREKQFGKETTAKVSIFSELRAALEAHATIEEEIFYPAVKRARSENVKNEVREGYEERKQIKSLLAQISSITPVDETYDVKIKVLKEDVAHHVKDEEGKMFPDARKFLSKTRLMELGAEMAMRKQQLADTPRPEREFGNQQEVRSSK